MCCRCRSAATWSGCFLRMKNLRTAFQINRCDSPIRMATNANGGSRKNVAIPTNHPNAAPAAMPSSRNQPAKIPKPYITRNVGTESSPSLTDAFVPTVPVISRGIQNSRMPATASGAIAIHGR